MNQFTTHLAEMEKKTGKTTKREAPKVKLEEEVKTIERSFEKIKEMKRDEKTSQKAPCEGTSLVLHDRPGVQEGEILHLAPCARRDLGNQEMLDVRFYQTLFDCMPYDYIDGGGADEELHR